MNLRTLRVLLVDDDEDDRLLTQALLRRVPETRYEIDLARSWEEGQAGLMAGAHDVYILDYAMGARTGLDLLRDLGSERASVTPIIFLTGTGNRTIDLDAMKAGAADFLVKGQTTASEIERSIRYAIERAALVAELRRHSSDLARSNAELEHFARSVSHDLKGPLTIIMAHLELLEMSNDRTLSEEGRQSLALASLGASRMARCIDDLLESACDGQAQARIRSADLNQTVRSVLSLFQGELTATNGTVQVDPLPDVPADPVQLEQLMRNLIGNAIKFHGDKPPKVHISAERTPAGWRIRVRDQGIGIPPEDVKRIFNLGQRASNAQMISGTGLGLAICQRIAGHHKGQLTVKSELGLGSEFILDLPAH